MYFLLCFTEFFVPDGGTKETIGLNLVAITIIICVSNSLPLIIAIKKYIKTKFLRKKIEKILRSRTEEQKKYGENLDRRCDFAIDNQKRFKSLLEYYNKGWMTDLAVANLQQTFLDKEHRMDTDYRS